MALKIPQFSKLPKHNRFNYSPLYYDKRKEELENKIKTAKQQKELQEKGEYKPEIKGKFVRKFDRGVIKKHNKSANVRLAIIIGFLGVILYFVFQKLDLISYMFDVLMSG